MQIVIYYTLICGKNKEKIRKREGKEEDFLIGTIKLFLFPLFFPFFPFFN
jgi:hypothetical protein